MLLDTAFDFRTDAGGRDPDIYSPTLRAYHRLLWSKPLPCGRQFELGTSMHRAYLHHASELGQFELSSDSVIPTFTRWTSLAHVIDQVPGEDREAFLRVGYTIGGMMIFPANRVDGKQTINGARGFNRKIADRLDLTLECIRRHYAGEDSPLAATLARYDAFFALFGDFAGYVDFFLLGDLVPARGSIEFFLPFDDFRGPAVPTSLAAYADYRARSVAFVEARNRRVERYVASLA